MNYKLLIVDDEPANLRALERLLGNRYDVITAASGAEALEMLAAHDVALILSDQRMPGMTGIEFLKKAAELRSNTVRIVLTGYTDVDTLVESINSGVVYRYVTKPWSNNDLEQTILRGIEYYKTLKTQYRLEQENQRMQHRMKSTVSGFVKLALELLELRGPKTGAHVRRTANYAAAMGRAMHMPERDIEQLFLAAMLHEVAHIRIPGHLLSRTTPLRDGEARLMQDHFKRGVKLLADVPDLEEISATINFQHDHYDGYGSPNRIAGDQIPLHSRIIAIVDAYDEMREPNTMTNGFSHDEALRVLNAAAGRKYDPALVEVFQGLQIDADVTPKQRELVAA